jgi:hypothetical protein
LASKSIHLLLCRFQKVPKRLLHLLVGSACNFLVDQFSRLH